jgi:hypothetical protein
MAKRTSNKRARAATRGKPTPEEQSALAEALSEFCQQAAWGDSGQWGDPPMPTRPTTMSVSVEAEQEAEQPPPPKLSGTDCLQVLFEPKRAELSAKTITEAATVLAGESGLTVGYCINLLRTTGVWKKKFRGQLIPSRPRSK